MLIKLSVAHDDVYRDNWGSVPISGTSSASAVDQRKCVAPSGK